MSLLLATLLGLLALLYARADPQTHLGTFYGNAIGDWLGVLVFVMATKYFFEAGSAESRQPARTVHAHVGRFLQVHSLTILLALTGLAWGVAFIRSDVTTPLGEVVGNIFSDWTQVLGLIVMTKYARERGSKEGG
jgi:hypothetical protein